MYKKPYVKANTYSGTYLAPVENHLIPFFGQMNMDDIRSYHIQQYINTAAEKYSPETIKKDYNALTLIFQTAVDNQLCSSNPVVKSIRMPKYETVTTKHAFTADQYNRVYDMAKSYENGTSIMMALETGVSRSELLGLCWEDLDLEQAFVHINQGTTYVFHSPEGKPYQPNNWVNRVYKPFMEEVHAKYPDIPKLSIHELRHTRATLWIAQGIDPYMVARLLGHSDLKMLTKIYDHTAPETLREALEQAVKPIDADKK